MLARMERAATEGNRTPLRERGALAALRHRPFAIVWSAALCSNIGTWLQAIAAPYVLFELTHSNTWLGIASAAGGIPALLCTPFAGVLADRLPRRRIILVTQAVQFAVAASLFGLAYSESFTPARMVSLLVLGGVANGLQLTSWQSFVPLLLPRQLLADGVRINSIQFTLSRALGPALAGVVLAAFGAPTAFLLNALSFGLVMFAVAGSRPREQEALPASTVFGAIADGLRYIRRTPTAFIAITTTFMMGFLGQSISQIAAGIAKQVFAVGPQGLGAMTAMVGCGGITGSVLIALFPDRVPRSRLAQTGLFTYAIGIAGVAAAPSLGFALVGFFAMGASHVCVMMSATTAIQTRVPDALRGRVISIYLASLFAGLPLGALFLGQLGDRIGLRAALACDCALLVSYACYAFVRFRRLSVLNR
jgi:MFS family permease